MTTPREAMQKAADKYDAAYAALAKAQDAVDEAQSAWDAASSVFQVAETWEQADDDGAAPPFAPVKRAKALKPEPKPEPEPEPEPKAPKRKPAPKVASRYKRG